MVPKSLALQRAEQMALTVTPIMQVITTILYPFIVTLNGVGNRILKVFGVRRQAETPDQYYTPEELQLIVQESEELGALRAESGQMLQELFEFGDLTASEVMVSNAERCLSAFCTPSGMQISQVEKKPMRPK